MISGKEITAKKHPLSPLEGSCLKQTLSICFSLVQGSVAGNRQTIVLPYRQMSRSVLMYSYIVSSCGESCTNHDHPKSGLDI